MKLNKKIVASLAATAAIFGSVSAQAATATATVQVTATILPSCILTTADINLGAYKASDAAAKTANGSIKVTCSRSLSYEVKLNGGNSGDQNNRQMTSGSNTLDYIIKYNNANFNDDNFISMAGASNTGVETIYQVKVEIPAGQFVPAGNYEDVLTATVDY
jgi:spore coat protein U-like protein